MHRRTFLKSSASLGTAFLGAVPGLLQGAGKTAVNDRIQLAVVGVKGRGGSLLELFRAQDDVDVRYICDVDPNVLKRRVEDTVKSTRHRPEAVADFRRVVADKNIDAVVLGTPDHWHAIPAIAACQAEKDVYVEKPDGHNVLESLTMLVAQRKYKRVVQLGTQARSAGFMLEAMATIRKGYLGRVRYATAWESQKQGALASVPDQEPPAGVDYDTWLGPAPKRPFNRKRFHGNWRWFFDYGTGDLGNDGVHRLDYARWGLETALEAQGEKLPVWPVAISSHGGKLYFDDIQEWPDTLISTYDYGGQLLTYEMRIWTSYPYHGEGEGAAVFGDDGYVILSNNSAQFFDADNEPGPRFEGSKNLDYTKSHIENFLECMRTRKKPNADLETVGHGSSMLCHLGNAAWRVGRTLKADAKTGSFMDDADARRYLTRPVYRKPWVLPKIAEL